MSARAIGLVLLGFVLWAAPAASQPAATDEELAGGPPAPPADETPEAKLDRLFAGLAAADAAAATALVDEIRREMSKSGSDSMDLILERGRKAMQEKNLERARMHFSALTRLAPDFAEGWNAAATLAYLEEDFGRAVVEIERALALEPRHFSALAGLAMILERLDRKPAALKAWREAQRLHPTLDRAEEAIRRLSPEVDGRAL